MSVRVWAQDKVALLWFIWIFLLAVGMTLPLPTWVTSNLIILVVVCVVAASVALIAPDRFDDRHHLPVQEKTRSLIVSTALRGPAEWRV